MPITVDPCCPGRLLLFDATTLLRWGPSAPTGIPRIEAMLVREALRNKSRSVKLFCFDKAMGRCRLLSEGEDSFARRVLDRRIMVTPEEGARLNVFQRVRFIAKVYGPNSFFLGNEAVRTIAQFILGDATRRGIRYSFLKAIVRVGVFFWRKFNCLKDPPPRPKRFAEILENGGECFAGATVSSEIANSADWPKLANRLHLFVYDTIALDFPEYFDGRHAIRFRENFGKLLAIAKTVVSMSEATRESCLRWGRQLGLDANETRFFVAPVNAPISCEKDESIPVTDLIDRTYVVYCSTIEPRKNHILLLKVWCDLLESRENHKVPILVFVGRWGWLWKPIAEYLRLHPEVANKVLILSFISDAQLSWVYKNALFAVFPSHAEGWGLSVSEALQFGTPVVISDIPPLREASQNLMPALASDDAGAWRAEIERLFDDTLVLERLRQRIKSEYKTTSADQIIERIYDIIN